MLVKKVSLRNSSRSFGTVGGTLALITICYRHTRARRDRARGQASIWVRVGRARCGARLKFSLPSKAPISAAPSKQTVENTQLRKYYLSHHLIIKDNLTFRPPPSGHFYVAYVANAYQAFSMSYKGCRLLHATYSRHKINPPIRTGLCQQTSAGFATV